MNRQAFRNRMQQLKQYREQNPGKTYLDFKKYADGGEIPPNNKPIIPEEPQPYKGKLYKDRYGRKYTEDQLADYYDNSSDEIDRFTGKPFVRGLRPVGDIEDAANVTPVGDAISVYDTYKALRNKDWGNAGLAALGLVPFMPSFGGVAVRSSKKISKPKSTYIPKVDPNYKQNVIDKALHEVYDSMLEKYVDIDEYFQLPDSVVLHEMGHLVDGAAGMNNEFLRKLGDKSKFIPFNQAKTMYPNMTRDMYNNILQGTEIKSYMNQFRNYLDQKGKLNRGNYTEGWWHTYQEREQR